MLTTDSLVHVNSKGQLAGQRVRPDSEHVGRVLTGVKQQVRMSSPRCFLERVYNPTHSPRHELLGKAVDLRSVSRILEHEDVSGVERDRPENGVWIEDVLGQEDQHEIVVMTHASEDLHSVFVQLFGKVVDHNDASTIVFKRQRLCLNILR